ncbi:MAG TPA: reverse transcriptase family protein [Candidatus Angelobacter sp.]|nr:reverse transcriptase family protein [Candidatus Angelobacter sp.]
MPNPQLLEQLARSMLAGDPSVEQIVARCSHTLGQHWHWLSPLANRYVRRFAGQTRPRHREVVEFLRNDRGFRAARSKHRKELLVVQWLTEPAKMQPVAVARAWGLPVLESIGVLARWLDISVEDLEWFADLKALNHRGGLLPLNHYSYRVLIKDSGDIRLLEAPKTRLKEMQRKILFGILDKIPAHPAVHGFVKGRSIKSCVALHAGRRVVLRMDLKDFFPSFSARRIQTAFRTFGYPESVADLLGGVCTTFTPHGLWAREKCNPPLALQIRQHARDLYCRPHLPQGAPSSPALANICSHRLDCRLAGLAKSAGAVYSRYADDCAFSGDHDFEKVVNRFSLQVAAILTEEGFHVNHRKTRVMRQGVRQHIAGLVANSHPNIIRVDIDRLKATLTNCLRYGHQSQNRQSHADFRSHLEGRVAFVESINPAKGQRLRVLMDRIEWRET